MTSILSIVISALKNNHFLFLLILFLILLILIVIGIERIPERRLNTIDKMFQMKALDLSRSI
jgi:uncharacterized membrane protein